MEHVKGRECIYINFSQEHKYKRKRKQLFGDSYFLKFIKSIGVLLYDM